jgi:hypothetical protein
MCYILQHDRQGCHHSAIARRSKNASSRSCSAQRRGCTAQNELIQFIQPPSSDIVKPPKPSPADGAKRKIGGQHGHQRLPDCRLTLMMSGQFYVNFPDMRHKDLKFLMSAYLARFVKILQWNMRYGKSDDILIAIEVALKKLKQQQ